MTAQELRKKGYTVFEQKQITKEKEEKGILKLTLGTENLIFSREQDKTLEIVRILRVVANEVEKGWVNGICRNAENGFVGSWHIK